MCTTETSVLQQCDVHALQMDNKQLLRAVDAACSDLGLQPVDAFVEKVVQLHETTVVRHGLMLVGPAMAGKTCCYRVLARALSALAAAGVPGFERVCWAWAGLGCKPTTRSRPAMPACMLEVAVYIL